jgi:predicted GNAT family acetyltransferase
MQVQRQEPRAKAIRKYNGKQMITLSKITSKEIPLFHQMQVTAFTPLLQKYNDYDKNPACEKIEKVYEKYATPNSDFYFISSDNNIIGGTRIIRLKTGVSCRIAPIFVIPEYQNQGFAQQAMFILEEMYKPISPWILDTVLQEEKLCHLYEKIGYVKTGKTEEVNELMTIIYYEKHIKDK